MEHVDEVGEHVLERADVPDGVVVGVDGSASSLRALRAAAEEARLRGCALHVVRAWTLRTAPRPPDCPPGAVPSLAEYSDYVREQTEELVTEQLGAEPGIPVRVHAIHSPSPQGLIAASTHAALLVVGHRGRGGFAGLVLGSVADQCVRHARCPVLVVRPNI
ncbi:Nucleotide-binding universal stress protein, UspA family [Streptoalloteichus tenebrarius]|uniref:Nucleotide-binding universal stress protein, UspA family n=1 Tax=Streptoalloteichus tenebrarius (strain ATCC 17920 / DSM 40477 / JCM 4838 / CBS 697.72 / NBRC 16177 / NCIMB 11028 / NRRL B-12390 / A12253. 1 / ISP 5477) TaxID=1933 RepID=A0ABT1I3H3_STRSD|nr:Nucleotide-binding universal stress protein, UspA family [Streptoalloteichus tenebrarius]BFF02057.1 hypothetical protein GCM10020241_37320 [Streptoalloteichus tenebrarius]